jgi:hypothetical protein
MRDRSFLPLQKILVGIVAGVLGVASGCSCEGGGGEDEGGGAQSSTSGTAQGGASGTASMGQFTDTGVGGMAPQCVNLECQQVDCGAGVTTTVSGTVFDPSGTLPLYNVVVYVPNAPVEPIPDGLSCDQCGAQLSGDPLVSAITDTQGRFTLQDVPVGADIPLVIQIGKWRRQITIPAVTQCVDNPLTDPQQTRLPRSMAEGNIPRIALTTGSADPFFCLLRRLGIDDSEFGVAGSAARIHFYRGYNGSQQYDAGFGASPGASFPDGPSTLWTNGWANYDLVLLSCEGDEYPSPKNGRRQALRDYLNEGGRVFATHYHYNWFQGDAPPDLQSIATFTALGNTFDALVDIDTSFPKGMALADWMMFVDGSSPYGRFFVSEGRQHTLTLNQMLARLWVSWQGEPEYFSFNAPIGAPEDMQCGRMVFSDIHVSAGAGSPTGSFPSACNNSPLSEQEKALIFMLFDLSACIIPDDDPMCPPGQQNCGEPDDPPCPGQCVNECCQDVPR